MICPRCQSDCKDGEEFCHVCGNKINAVKVKSAVAEKSNYEGETTLLEDSSSEETTLLDENPSSLSYSDPIQPTVQPEQNNLKAETTDYRYSPKTEDNKKEKMITLAIIAVVAIIIIALLFNS